ncbi:MAG TPA: hypothetical protein VHW25_18030 [Steroidobacteraceae bacterium]|nr:hypothetical protein [Steroidobacteraceae bacterium]
MPFHSAPLILVVVLTILWTLFIKFGRFIGIPADFILLSWFFKYCYALLDAVVAGHKDLPVMSVEMINPVDEQRPLIQAIMVSLGFIASWWVYHSIGPMEGIGLGVVLLIALPATVALLAISDSWVHAISPVAIGRVVKGLGLSYVGAVLVTLGGALAIIILALGLDSLLLILALAQFVLLAMFSFIGGAIFESRVELQLDTRTHGERVAERDDKHHADARGAVLDRAYALLRLKRRSEAWTHLQAWMRQHCPATHPFTEYHALQEATCSWDEPIIGDQVTNEYLGRLLANDETGMALEALQVRLKSNPGYYPQGQAYAQRLTELVRLSGRKALSRQLLANAPAPQ